MKKLTLAVDALTVESFSIGREDEQTGTVQGRELAPTYPSPGCPFGTKPTNCPCTPRI